ncbi:hypothetical protein D9M71_773220 [compost metagenome]
MAHTALGDPNAFGELLLGDIELLHPVTDEGNPFIHIHRWHDTDCLQALNKHSVLFIRKLSNTLGISIDLNLFPIGIGRYQDETPEK